MSEPTRRDIIMARVEDMAVDFLYYDRKEDEQLGRGEIEDAVSSGEITIADMLGAFASQLATSVPEADLDPLHARARKAIAALGLDVDRFERAVAIFGWNSDEANGSLLGLACAAWDDPHVFVRFRTASSPRYPKGCWICYLADAYSVDGETKPEAILAAIEAKAAGR